MSRLNLSRWTCDSCGTVKEESTNEQPARWSAVAIAWKAADPSWDHAAWKRYVMCDACLPQLQDGHYRLRNLSGTADADVQRADDDEHGKHDDDGQTDDRGTTHADPVPDQTPPNTYAIATWFNPGHIAGRDARPGVVHANVPLPSSFTPAEARALAYHLIYTAEAIEPF